MLIDETDNLRRRQIVDGQSSPDASADVGGADVDLRDLNDVGFQCLVGGWQARPVDLPSWPRHDEEVDFMQERCRLMPRWQLSDRISSDQPVDGAVAAGCQLS